MFVCWSVKGGSGTSVAAALLAVALSGSRKTVLIDTQGDQSAIFGVGNSNSGFRQWMSASCDVPVSALSRLVVSLNPSLDLVPAGQATTSTDVVQRPLDLRELGTTVVDAGLVSGGRSALLEQATKSFLVLRPCYLAAKRVSDCSASADGLIVVEEAGRALTARDLADVTGIPLAATVAWDASIARMIDAGRVGRKIPRFAREIDQLATELIAAEERT